MRYGASIGHPYKDQPAKQVKKPVPGSVKPVVKPVLEVKTVTEAPKPVEEKK